MLRAVVPSAGQLKAFLDLFGSSSFAHSREVLPLFIGLGSAQAVGAKLDVHEIPAGCDLRGTYQMRAELLTAKERDGRVLPPTLAEDVRQLSAGLNATTDQPVQVWRVALPDGT